MNKTALITGISGQDGSYLAELLLAKGYEVHGVVKRAALEDPGHKLWRLGPILNRLFLHSSSMQDHGAVSKIVRELQPDECYHLAAESFVSYSFQDELPTINNNITGTLLVLSALKEEAPHCRFYFAGSSEMFGNAAQTPQNENTPFNPRSPYGISKVAGFHLTRSYRELYNLHACSGILFNHESPRRGFEFVTRKITNAVARIKLGKATELRLGNLEATRDWGFSGDYVEAMWLILQQDPPGDYVIASGISHSVREFVELAFQEAALDWRDYVVIDQTFVRPNELRPLRGDYSKARRGLGWSPKVGFHELVRMMVKADLDFVAGKR
jgi:GDPmannose 4,6-dehydratase